ncbi:hypothetical protein F6X40_16960 [Paraburkholderia sp. UCT31]|nr:hypothetical protein [Paraburkholderia sp. UCT31]
MTANFIIDGKEGSNFASIKKVIEDVAGKNAEVNVSDIGIITVRSNAQALRRVDRFLRDFSRDAMTQVDIQASIVEVSLEDDLQFGINWQRVLGATNILGSAGSLTAGFGNSAITNPSLTAQFTGAKINAVIQALRNITDTKVISEPRILAVNDTPSTFFDGTSMPYLGSVNSTTTGVSGTTQTSGNTSFAVDGISFSVQPHVLDDTHVQLTLMPVISTIQSFTTFNLGNNGGTLTAPVQQSKQTFMKVMAETGKTVILGGIRYSQTVKKDAPGPVPVLTDGRNNTTQEKEVVILLRTNIIPAPAYDPLISESI